MGDSSDFSWLQIVPWGLVALGWVVVNHQNNGRENRKEIRAKIDAIKNAVSEVEDLAIEHHTKVQDAIRCMKIKRVLTRVAREISVMSVAGVNTSDIRRALTRMRQAATLNNFETIGYKPLSLEDPIVADIGATSDGLRSQLERSYSEKFQRSLVALLW